MSIVAAGEAWRVRRASGLKGFWTPPGDKSVSHRALMFGALSNGPTKVDGFLPAGDCLSTANVLGRLGVTIRFLNEARTSLEIEGLGLRGLKAPAEPAPLDCGNSGTTMRLMAGILAAHPFRSALSGDASLTRRPMKRIVEPLRLMGASISARGEGDTPPIEIEGAELKGIAIELPVASAQVKSALLLAGLQAAGTTRVKEPSSSRDHTERQLRRLGAAYRVDEGGWHAVDGGVVLSAQPWQVPGDFSTASFFLAAAAICSRSDLTITGVGVNPGRIGLLEVLTKMGARIAVTNQREVSGEPVADLVIKGGAPLKGIRVAGDMIPRIHDEVPVLAVVACCADGVTIIRDAGELRVKETDRIAAVASELTKLGAKVGVLADGLAIEGSATLKGAEVTSHGDHRMAMALAVAGLVAAGETQVTDTACVATSYPGFATDLASLAGEG